MFSAAGREPDWSRSQVSGFRFATAKGKHGILGGRKLGITSRPRANAASRCTSSEGRLQTSEREAADECNGNGAKAQRGRAATEIERGHSCICVRCRFG